MKLKLILTSNAAKTQKTNEKMSFKTKLRYLTYHGFESDEKNQKKVEICWKSFSVSLLCLPPSWIIGSGQRLSRQRTLSTPSVCCAFFKMSLTGRTLNILGRSATRIRCTGLQRLRSEYAEGPGNVSVWSL